MTQRVIRDFSQRSRHLHPVARRLRRQRQPCASRRVARFPFRSLECQKDSASNLGGIFNRFQCWRKLRHCSFRNSGGSIPRLTISESYSTSPSFRMSAPRRGVQIDHLAEKHLSILAAPQNHAQRRSDLARRERSGRHLVEQG